MKLTFSRLLYMLLIATLLAGCAPGGNPIVSANVVDVLSAPADQGFVRATTPIEFRFPLDHGAHPAYRTEWWYYTGVLRAETGVQFGYQLTFFRNGLSPGTDSRPSDWATNQIYMAHLAVSEVAAQKHHSAERFSRGAGGLAGATGEPQYEIWLDDWSVRTIRAGVTQLQASDRIAGTTVALDVTLEESRPPLLHGDKGLSQKGKETGNANYYYSLVQIKTSGTVTVGDKVTPVQGISWMDHEFGTNALSQGTIGWDWFGLQMENGLVLMFAQLRTNAGRLAGNFSGTLGWPDGRQIQVDQEDFQIVPVGEWKSPTTNVIYPSGWRVTFPKEQIELQIEPLIPDQEMKVSFVYWEGAVKVTGTVANQPTAGVGYVELTGYGEANDAYQR